MTLWARISEEITHVFDWCHQFWERKSTHNFIVSLQVFTFLGGILAVLFSWGGLFPPAIAHLLPESPFMVISVAFTLVLIQEVISLLFTLPCSFSKSVGKQYEILALILLRNAFKELAGLHGLMTFSEGAKVVAPILVDGFGALAIFSLLAVYLRIQRPAQKARHGSNLYSFVTTKKIVALFLLFTFVSLGLYNGVMLLTQGELLHFFPLFYSILIFADIFVVIIAQRYRRSFEVVFRNSGLALSTLLIRMALAAPVYWNALLGILAALFGVCLIFVNNMIADARSGKE